MSACHTVADGGVPAGLSYAGLLERSFSYRRYRL